MTPDKPNTDHLSGSNYRAVFEHSVDPTLILEGERFVDCNQAAVELLGYDDKQSLLDRHPSEISPERQPDGRCSMEKATEILASVHQFRSKRFEWMHLTRDGRPVPVDVSMTRISDDGIPVLHIAWRDISQRKQLQNELRQSQKLEVLGSLAGGIAHDFNNTLVPILSYSNLLATALGEQHELREWATEIHRAGALASSLVRKLLSVGRKEARTPVVFDLEQTVEEALKMVRKLIGEDIAIEFERAGAPVWIQAEFGDIEQILLNLASNARDALPSGGNVRITLSTVMAGPGQRASLTFSDNGVGMDSEALERVFDPFFTTKELGCGTGLGMASVQQLVDKASGTVSARSTPGSGTTIEMLFPVSPPPAHAAGSDQEHPKHRPSAPDGSIATARILVVEDEPQIARLIRIVLSREGYLVRTAGDGREAMELLEREARPDLVLSDVVLPSTSGPELVNWMREMGITSRVVFMSGYTDDRLSAHGFDERSLLLLKKPFTPSDLLGRVADELGTPQGTSPTCALPS